VKVLRIVVGAVVLSVGAPALAGTSGSAGGAAVPATMSLSRSGHVSYQGCPAQNVELTVMVSARTFGLGQNVRYMVRLHNLSAKACLGVTQSGPVQSGPTQPGPTQPGPRGSLSFALGPCGSLPLWITNSRGARVYPDAGGISCPLLLGPRLFGHATLRLAGTWDRVEGARRPARIPTPAPPGRYRLSVGGVASVPFTLANSLPLAALTTKDSGAPA
jgi:hypothetical protein